MSTILFILLKSSHKRNFNTKKVEKHNLREKEHFYGALLQYSCLENPMDGGAWKAAVHGVAKSRTRLGDFTLTFHFHALEKEMSTHSSVLAWRIPGMGEPGGLPSIGSHRVGHDWSSLAAATLSIWELILRITFENLDYWNLKDIPESSLLLTE